MSSHFPLAESKIWIKTYVDILTFHHRNEKKLKSCQMIAIFIYTKLKTFILFTAHFTDSLNKDSKMSFSLSD